MLQPVAHYNCIYSTHDHAKIHLLNNYEFIPSMVCKNVWQERLRDGQESFHGNVLNTFPYTFSKPVKNIMETSVVAKYMERIVCAQMTASVANRIDPS